MRSSRVRTKTARRNSSPWTFAYGNVSVGTQKTLVTTREATTSSSLESVTTRAARERGKSRNAPLRSQQQRGAVAAGSFGRRRLVREKEMYNPFNYRCSKADGLREHWQEFKQYASEEDQRRFVLDVINAKPGIIPPAALERKERLIRERTSGSTGSWISFKAAADVDGEDMVKEWIANGTVRTRFNLKLTKGTQIKWPFFLEIAKETEVWSDLDKLKTEQVKTETMEDTEGFKSDFDGRWGAVGKSSSASVAEEARADPSPLLPDDRDKVAMMHLQKAHSLWDKTKRSWEGTLAKSATNSNTNGCRFEALFKEATAYLDAVDSKNMALEQKHLSGYKKLKQAASQTMQLIDGIKDGKKKETELNRWMRLS